MLKRFSTSYELFCGTFSPFTWIKVCTLQGYCFLKTLYGSSLWMGFNYLKASRSQFNFLLLSFQKFLLLIWSISKGERLNRHCSHPMVLNTGPLDWESSALTTRPLLTVYALKMQYIYVTFCETAISWHKACNYATQLPLNIFSKTDRNFCSVKTHL